MDFNNINPKWLFLGAVVVLVGVLFINIVSTANYGNRAEKNIQFEHENLSNILGQYGNKVTEAAQIPEMYRDDVTKVITAAITSRYGKDGSKAAFQWLQEQNPSLDSKVYVQIQQIIEAGRNEYQNAQTKFLDVKKGYATALGTVWTGFLLAQLGYPKINLDDYKTTTTDIAAQALKTGRDNGLKLRAFSNDASPEFQ